MNTNNDNPVKVPTMVQQTFHKSMFQRNRSNSVGTTPKEVLFTKKPNDRKPTNPKSWQKDQVPKTKRKRTNNSPEAQDKVTKITKVALAIPTHNQFDDLDLVNNADNSEKPVEKPQPRPPKPEGIYVTGVMNIQLLKELMAEITDTSKFTLHTMRCGHIVKVMPNDIDTYKKIREEFINRDVKHYTYKLKCERAYRVILRGLHASENTETIKEELEELGHKVRQVVNVLHKTTKEPLSVFYVDLEPNANNKEIFKVDKLNYMKVSFEAPYIKKEILQCKRCQRFGHTKNQCFRPFRCVKCGEEHPTNTCNKAPDIAATCANCQEKHPASYKGCKKYQQYKELRSKTKQDSTKNKQHQKSGKDTKEEDEKVQHQQDSNNNGYTYAKAASMKAPYNATKNNPQINDANLVGLLDSMFDRFQKLISNMLDNMMDRMIQLIAHLIPKCP